MPRIMLMVMALSLGALLTACGTEEAPQTAVPAVGRRPEAATPALTTRSPASEEEPYAYDTGNRRDPFKPLIATPKAADPDVGQGKLTCPPMQAFELTSLKVVAIVWGDMGRKAMLKAPNGRGYTVTEDMRLGRNCGRIHRIDSNAVVIEETRQDTEGRVLKEEVVLRLREREG